MCRTRRRHCRRGSGRAVRARGPGRAVHHARGPGPAVCACGPGHGVHHARGPGRGVHARGPSCGVRARGPGRAVLPVAPTAARGTAIARLAAVPRVPPPPRRCRHPCPRPGYHRRPAACGRTPSLRPLLAPPRCLRRCCPGARAIVRVLQFNTKYHVNKIELTSLHAPPPPPVSPPRVPPSPGWRP